MIVLVQGPLIDVGNITAGYPSHIALENVSFKVDYKEKIAIVGPNGGGKSTLLKTLVGLIKPFQGYVNILGEKPYKNLRLKSKIAYLPQQSTINPNFPALVGDIVKMGLFKELGLLRRINKDHKKRIVKALEQVSMEKMINEPFLHLSGGQKQRVLIARALIGSPKVMFLDEPTTGLDVDTQKAISRLVKLLTESEKLTIIAVTHDQTFLKNWAERIMKIEKTVTFDGDAELYFRSEV